MIIWIFGFNGLQLGLQLGLWGGLYIFKIVNLKIEKLIILLYFQIKAHTSIIKSLLFGLF